MEIWLPAAFALIGGSVGIWMVWCGNSGARSEENVQNRMGASAFLLLFLSVFVLLGSSI